MSQQSSGVEVVVVNLDVVVGGVVKHAGDKFVLDPSDQWLLDDGYVKVTEVLTPEQEAQALADAEAVAQAALDAENAAKAEEARLEQERIDAESEVAHLQAAQAAEAAAAAAAAHAALVAAALALGLTQEQVDANVAAGLNPDGTAITLPPGA